MKINTLTGGLVEAGAHGEMQGVGIHWEMKMFNQSGLLTGYLNILLSNSSMTQKDTKSCKPQPSTVLWRWDWEIKSEA